MKKVLMMPRKNPGDYHLAYLERVLVKEGISLIFPNNNPRFFSLPVIKEILKSKVKILHIHWIHTYAGFNTKYKLKSAIKAFLFFMDIYIAKFFFKLKIVWTIHNLYSHESYHPKLEKMIRQHFSKNSDAIIVHCNQAKIIVHKEFGIPKTKIYVIPQGNYTQSYKNEISKQEARKILNLEENNFVFLYFGRIRPHKGVDQLIKSYINLKERKNVKMLIIGRPLNIKIENKLTSFLRDIRDINFRFEFIPDDEIQIYMNAADVVVTPYKKVLSSGEILISMGFGKPIIAPRLGCIIDKLNNLGAFLYDQKDKNGLRKALEKALENKDKLFEMGKNNFNYSSTFFWNGKETKKVYNKIA